MAQITVDLGFAEFGSKSAAKEHFRAMLNRYQAGQTVKAEDAAELECLLDSHPEAADKIGCGVAEFRVRDAAYGTICFEVVRTDGSATDFSYASCIDGRASPLQEALRALRQEVQDDIMRAKRDYFAQHADAEGRVLCPVSGVRITIEEAHADHASPLPFAVMAKLFLSARGIVPDRSTVQPPADNQYVPRLADHTLADEWRKYHHQNAAIRVVAAPANRKAAAASKVRKSDRQLKLPT